MWKNLSSPYKYDTRCYTIKLIRKEKGTFNRFMFSVHILKYWVCSFNERIKEPLPPLIGEGHKEELSESHDLTFKLCSKLFPSQFCLNKMIDAYSMCVWQVPSALRILKYSYMHRNASLKPQFYTATLDREGWDSCYLLWWRHIFAVCMVLRSAIHELNKFLTTENW